ncbi:unnamed protein product [Thlaspi arvense]|uniref:HR-like lesion-inducer n=1 Tax=Thlaspi arvense TaxID=13288 RepID=A0AAU9S0N0_THLAR|nr:unnamed protein product [Thlaspi arvense]
MTTEMEAGDYWRPEFGYSGDQIKHLMAVSIIGKTLGGLIFIYGSFFGAFLLLLHQGIATMIHHDFYSHRIDIEELGLLYLKFKKDPERCRTMPHKTSTKTLTSSKIEKAISKFREILNETMSYDTANSFYKSNFDAQQVEQVIKIS